MYVLPLEVWRLKDTVGCVALRAITPGHCQDQLMQTQCVCYKCTFLHRPLIVKSQQNRIELVTRLGLLQRLGSSISRTLLAETSLKVVDTLFSTLLHPSPSCRLAGAWCLRCLAVASPSHLTPSLDRALDIFTLGSSSGLVGFLQSKINEKQCVFTKSKLRFAIIVLDGILRALRLARHTR